MVGFTPGCMSCSSRGRQWGDTGARSRPPQRVDRIPQVEGISVPEGDGSLETRADPQFAVLGFQGRDRVLGESRYWWYIRKRPPVGPVKAETSASATASPPSSSSSSSSSSPASASSLRALRALYDLDAEALFVHRSVMAPAE